MKTKTSFSLSLYLSLSFSLSHPILSSSPSSAPDLGPQDHQHAQPQRAGHAPGDHLVRRHPPRHDPKDPPRARDRVVGAAERVGGVDDRLALPLEVLEDRDAELLEREGVGWREAKRAVYKNFEKSV